MNEVWVSIHGYETHYQVSNLGSVKSLARPVKMRWGATKMTKEKILKPAKVGGYLFVGLRGKAHYIHRLVAAAFIPNPDNLPEVNHKDGDKSNNRKDNLEWMTRGQNYWHGRDTGLIPRPPALKLTDADVLAIATSAGRESQKKTSLKYGISQSLVCMIRTGKRWSHITGVIGGK